MKILRDELTNKTHQYMELMSALSVKQQELSKSQETNSRLERRCEDLEGKAKRMTEMEEVSWTMLEKVTTWED